MTYFYLQKPSTKLMHDKGKHHIKYSFAKKRIVLMTMCFKL